MDHKKIKEKLIDYIDKNLNPKEEKEIKTHLENCLECKKEYEELKSTISYIEDKSKDIGRDRELNLNPVTKKKRYFKYFTRTGIIAMALSLILVVTAFATEIFGFMDWWKKSSKEQTSAWEKLVDNGVGQKLDKTVTDKNIKVTAKGVIADDLNTIILLEVRDLNGKIRFTPSFRDVGPFGPVRIEGDIISKWEEMPPLVNYSNIYVDEEGVLNLILKTEPMDKKEGKIRININKFSSMINENEESIVDVSGNWDLNIDAKKIESKRYKVDKKVDINGNELIIEEIVLAPTTTSINYKFDVYSKEEVKFLRDLSFSIKYNGKTYGRSELSYSDIEEMKDFGYQEGQDYMQSLYLEDPEEIELIVDTARYISRGAGHYYLDWDNLPQTIDYQGSKLIVKDIEYKEDSTEITIIEDMSPDREYIRTEIYLEKGVPVEFEDNGETIEFNRDYPFYGSHTKWETYDENGKIENPEGVFWTDKMYNFTLEQKIGLREDEFKNRGIDEKHYEELLKPDKLVIKGQKYIYYPDKKINIKLK